MRTISEEGPGILSGVTFVQRVNTVGGLAPSTPGAFVGQETQVPYTAEYLAKLKRMDGLAPVVMKAFWAFDNSSVADGAIPVKYTELIAVAVALTTQCPHCIDIHGDNCRTAGASHAEMVEAAMIAASLRARAAVTHATHLLPD